MTPGPIAPRVHVDPGPRSLQQADGEPGRSDEGRSFEDLLQAMLAPGVQSDSAAPRTPEAVFERLDAAQIFNETGLFRGAAPLTKEDTLAGGARTPAAPARPEISTEAALQLSLAPSPGAGAGADAPPAGPAPAARQIALTGGSAPSGASRPTSRAALREAISLRGQPESTPQNPVRTPEAGRESAAPGRMSRAAAMLVQAYLAKGGSAAAQVSVQAVEGGISLVARADKLSREERDKLRIEIGELLARHGLAAAEIMLNGEAGPSPQGRDE